MSIKEYDTYKTAYPVKSVKRGYGFYIRMLFEKCLGMFDYTGLPASLPRYSCISSRVRSST